MAGAQDPVRIAPAEAEALVTRVFVACRTSPGNARATARALVAAQADGQAGHGLTRVPSYAAQARSGKVDGHATPALERVSPAAVRIDAGLGFAYPAIDLALATLEENARGTAVAAAAIHRSHHFGQAGAHAERLAERGLVALVFGNSPKGIAPWGGREAVYGTNPIAFAAPLAGRAPLVIDLAVSRVARGRIAAAGQRGETIPGDWAFDAEGRATTDPAAAMAGSLAPIGGAKGAALALMVEILSAALTGARFGFEASSLFDADGEPPNLGHLLLAFDAEALAGGGFAVRLPALVAAIEAQPGVRLPGERRLEARRRAAREGLAVPRALHDEIRALLDDGE